MKISTTHKIMNSPSQNLPGIPSSSVQLVVTSPPYPMIEMWDKIMADQNLEIQTALDNLNGALAFELMHRELDKVWMEINRVLVPGGMVCINIGDATRTINNDFALYTNHSRVISGFLKFGFVNLPNILWRKPTNAPNKFMGSGMLPAGAYVTLEHEWILIFRKGGKRGFKEVKEKQCRKESAFFWEERNTWFSDVWDVKGTKQSLPNAETRDRSAAYPFEIPYRLINMFSVKGDTVLDPFLGTGTTSVAALCSERNSIGVETDPALCKLVRESMETFDIRWANNFIHNRIEGHRSFIENEKGKSKVFKHFNENLNMEVTTLQEKELKIFCLEALERMDENSFGASYCEKSK